MSKLNNFFMRMHVTNFGTHKTWLVLALTIALFVLAAGAPNATIGIGR